MKMTKQFAARFSHADWGTLCGNSEFLAAVDAGEYGVAEVIAQRVLTATPSPDAEHRHVAGRLDSIITIYLPTAEAELVRVQAIPGAVKAVRRAQRHIEELQLEAARLSKCYLQTAN